MVCGGYVKPWMEGNHLEVFWENCVDITMNFLNRGYDVIFNYICTPEDTKYIESRFKDIEIKLCILLCDKRYYLDTTLLGIEEIVREIIKNDKFYYNEHQ